MRKLAQIKGVDPDLLGLIYDGQQNPFPYPDIHWDLVMIWSILDGTIPPPMVLKDGSTLDYTSTLLRDPASRERWTRKAVYASKGFRLR